MLWSSLINLGTLLSELLFFFIYNKQNHSIHLTGLFKRLKEGIFLQEKLESSVKGCDDVKFFYNLHLKSHGKQIHF